MAWIKLNASDPAPPSGSEGNVHFRQSPGHAGTQSDPIPTSAFFNVISWIGKHLDLGTMGAPTDGQVPTWDAASISWKAKTPSSGGGGGGGAGSDEALTVDATIPFLTVDGAFPSYDERVTVDGVE